MSHKFNGKEMSQELFDFDEVPIDEIMGAVEERKVHEEDKKKFRIADERRVVYNSVGEVIEACKMPIPRWVNNASSIIGDSDFAGRSFEDSVKLIEFGEEEQTDMIKKVRDDLNDRIKDMRTEFFDDIYHDVEGSLVDVPLYLDGEPECMIQVAQEAKKPTVMRIFMPMTAPWHYDKKILARRGCVCAAMIDALELRGIRCEVYSVYQCNIKRTMGTPFSITVKIKDAGEPMSIERMGATIVNAEWLRRIGFRLLELNRSIYESDKWAYGSCTMDSSIERKGYAVNNGCKEFDIVIPEHPEMFKTEEAAANTVINMVNLHTKIFEKEEVLGGRDY